MIKEHAVTLKGKITEKELEYVILKANRLGWSQRTVVGITTESDAEGVHVYMQVTDFKENK